MGIWRDLYNVPRAFAGDVATAGVSVQRWLFQDPQIVAATGGSRSEAAHEAYNAKNALSAMAAFPWVWACNQAIITDLSGLPLVATRTDSAGRRKVDKTHPTAALFKRPHPQCSGVRFRRQIYTDFVLTGEAYIRRIDTEVGPVLTRLHPGTVTPVVDPATGIVDYYEWGDLKLHTDEVLQIADVGWLDGIRQSRGESAIHSLEAGLLAAQDARKHARKAAKRGRLEMLLMPADIRAQFGSVGVGRIRDAYVSAAEGGSGALVLNRALKATPMSLSPRELEFSQLSSDVRDETLAVMGVPPVRVGLPGANYGTARAQLRTYWERLRHIAALFDAEFSRLTGDGAEIAHDFTGVDALQTSATERQARAERWVHGFGMSPADAAEYEGFHDAPAMATSAAEVNPNRPIASDVPEEPQEASLSGAVARWLRGASSRYQGLVGSGSIPDSAESYEAWRLADLLIEAGYPAENAHLQSVQCAAIVHESVSHYVRTANGDAVIGIAGIGAFSRAAVERFTAQLERAA